MSPIKSTDYNPNFIPINNSQSNNSNTNSAVDPTNINPEFQKILQTFLQNLADAGPENGAQTGLDNSLAAMLNQNGAGTALPWEQLLQAQIQSPDSNGVNDPLTDFAYAVRSCAMIAKYKVAVDNFKNALKTSPYKLNDLDLDKLSQMTDQIRGTAPALSETFPPGTNPTKQQVVEYIGAQCREIGIPEQLGLATAATESEMTQFNKDGSPYRHSNSDSSDWGIMQVNDKAWGDRYDLNRLKTDWQYNVRAGLEILKNSYDAAVRNGEDNKGPDAAIQNLARAAYSGYNAGTANIWRYRTRVQDAAKTGSYNVLDNEGFDLRDVRFWDNYRQFS